MKTSELIGDALDWAVSKAEGMEDHYLANPYSYSTNWIFGGSIIEREKITIVCAQGDYNQKKAGTPECYDTYWVADKGRQSAQKQWGPQGDYWGNAFHIEHDGIAGPTPLIAAMRCYVASKLGDEVEIPPKLK